MEKMRELVSKMVKMLEDGDIHRYGCTGASVEYVDATGNFAVIKASFSTEGMTGYDSEPFSIRRDALVHVADRMSDAQNVVFDIQDIDITVVENITYFDIDVRVTKSETFVQIGDVVTKMVQVYNTIESLDCVEAVNEIKADYKNITSGSTTHSIEIISKDDSPLGHVEEMIKCIEESLAKVGSTMEHRYVTYPLDVTNTKKLDVTNTKKIGIDVIVKWAK